MDGLTILKDEKLSEFARDIALCEMCCQQVKETLDIYKPIAAEHEWALEQIKMFETSSKECASLHGLAGFNELNDKVKAASLTLQEFKQELEDAALEVKNLIDEQNRHIELLKETRAKVVHEIDMELLDEIEVPWKDWMWCTPENKMNEVAEQWKSMDMINRLTEFLLEQRLLINHVNENTPRTEDKSEN